MFSFFNKKGGWAPWFGRNTLGIADFISHSSGQRTLPQSSNTRAAKDGSGPRPAAQSAKRCFLNCLETSFRPSIRLLSCTASSPLACVLLQLAFVLHSSSQRTFPQSSNTRAVKDGSGLRPAAQSVFLHCQLPTFYLWFSLLTNYIFSLFFHRFFPVQCRHYLFRIFSGYSSGHYFFKTYFH